MYAEHGLCRAARFDALGADQRAEHDAAGFGLPPGIDNRAALFADGVEIPVPGFRVDRLTDAAQQAQAGAGCTLQRAVAFAHQGAQGGGRCVEDIHLVFIDDLPEARTVRITRHAFEHQRGGAIGQRAINDIAVAGDPAHVGGAPEHFAFLVIEHVLEGHRRLQQVASGGVQHAFGFAGAAGGIEDEQRVFSVHRLGWAVVAGGVQGSLVLEVAAFVPIHARPGALHHQYRADIRATGQGFVDVLLQRHGLATAYALVGGDHGAAISVEDAVAQGVRRETTKHHRVHCANSRAGQHGVGRLGDHRHVDAHAITFVHATAFQHIGQAADVLVQLTVSNRAGF